MEGQVDYITKSLTAMSLAVAAAFFFAVGTACGVGAWASLTLSNTGTFTDLGHATNWLQFVAGLAAVALVCAAGWELVLRRDWKDVWEVSGGAVGALLIAIGLLIAATSDGDSSASNIVAAVGIGVWFLLVLVRAARSSLAEQRPDGESASRPGEAKLWLFAAVGLFILAIGRGFNPGIDEKGVAIAAGVLMAAGTAVLFGALVAARLGTFLTSRTVPVLLAGLIVAAAGFAAYAVVAGLVFGPDVVFTDFTGLRVGLSIVQTIILVAVALLGVSAWMRIRELVSTSPRHGTNSITQDGTDKSPA
jgi:hypothetical protein